MNNKKITGILLHSLFWFVVITLAIIFREPKLGGILQKYQIALITLVIGVLSFYINFKLSTRLIYGKFSWQWLIIQVLTILILTLGYYLLVNMFIDQADKQFSQYYSLPIVLFFSISGMMFQGFHFSLKQREKEQDLIREKLDLELSLIRTQLNPHFLFNILNNIDYYIKKNPGKASDSVIRLSDLLRYLLYETSEANVPIENEVIFLEGYFDLQKQRIREDNICIFTKEVKVKAPMIAPAIFLPFLENAFVHGSLNEPGAYLNFEICSLENKIVFSLRNSKIPSRIPKKSGKQGLGIELSKRRLNLLYKNRHSLVILDHKTSFTVELILETNEDKMYHH